MADDFKAEAGKALEKKFEFKDGDQPADRAANLKTLQTLLELQAAVATTDADGYTRGDADAQKEALKEILGKKPFAKLKIYDAANDKFDFTKIPEGTEEIFLKNARESTAAAIADLRKKELENDTKADTSLLKQVLDEKGVDFKLLADEKAAEITARKAYDTQVDRLAGMYAKKDDATQIDPARINEVKAILVDAEMARGVARDGAQKDADNLVKGGKLSVDAVKTFLKDQYPDAPLDKRDAVTAVTSNAIGKEQARLDAPTPAQLAAFQKKAEGMAAYYTDGGAPELTTDATKIPTLARTYLVSQGTDPKVVGGMNDAGALAEANKYKEFQGFSSIVITSSDLSEKMTELWKKSKPTHREAIDKVVDTDIEAQKLAIKKAEEARELAAKNDYNKNVDTMLKTFAKEGEPTKVDPARTNELKEVMVKARVASGVIKDIDTGYASAEEAARAEVDAMTADPKKPLTIAGAADYLKNQRAEAAPAARPAVEGVVNEGIQAEVRRQAELENARKAEEAAKEAFKENVKATMADFADHGNESNKPGKTNIDPKKMGQVRKLMIDSAMAAKGFSPEEYEGIAAKMDSDKAFKDKVENEADKASDPGYKPTTDREVLAAVALVQAESAVATRASNRLFKLEDAEKFVTDQGLSSKDARERVGGLLHRCQCEQIGTEMAFSKKAGELADAYEDVRKPGQLDRSAESIPAMARAYLISSGESPEDVKRLSADAAIERAGRDDKFATQVSNIKTTKEMQDYIAEQWKASNDKGRKAIEAMVEDETKAQKPEREKDVAKAKAEDLKAERETVLPQLRNMMGDKATDAVADEVLKRAGEVKPEVGGFTHYNLSASFTARSGGRLGAIEVTDKNNKDQLTTLYVEEVERPGQKPLYRVLGTGNNPATMTKMEPNVDLVIDPQDKKQVATTIALLEKNEAIRTEKIAEQERQQAEIKRLETLKFEKEVANEKAKFETRANAAIPAESAFFSEEKRKGWMEKLTGEKGSTPTPDALKQTLVAKWEEAYRRKDKTQMDVVTSVTGDIEKEKQAIETAREVERERQRKADEEAKKPKTLEAAMKKKPVAGITIGDTMDMSSETNYGAKYGEAKVVSLQNARNKENGERAGSGIADVFVLKARKDETVLLAKLDDVARKTRWSQSYNGQRIDINDFDSGEVAKDGTLALALTKEDLKDPTANIKSVKTEDGLTTVTLNDGRSVQSANKVVFRFKDGEGKDATFHQMSTEEMQAFIAQREAAKATAKLPQAFEAKDVETFKKGSTPIAVTQGGMQQGRPTIPG